jgi:phosphosulfolactate phosphohydrolase-like enzyme
MNNLSLKVRIQWSDEAISTSGKRCALVFVDTLRASTTIAVALYSGAEKVFPVKDEDSAMRMRKTVSSAVVAGERGGQPLTGFDTGNSPFYMDRHSRGKNVILSTGNTTAVIDRFVCDDVDLFAAAFVNAQATVNHLIKKKYDEIVFIAVGTYKWGDISYEHPKKTHEDYFAAAYMVRLIEKSTGVLFRSINMHRRFLDRIDHVVDELKVSEYASFLLKQNNSDNLKDITISFTVDTYPVVAQLQSSERFYFERVS